MSRALVTGGHGFVGSHLAAGAARARRRGAGARPARAAPRRRRRRAALGARPARDPRRGRAGRGRPARRRGGRPRPLLASDAVFHLAAQTIVGVARESPLETFEVNVQRRLERLRGLPRARGRARSSSPPPTRPTARARSCPTARTSRCAPPTPTTPARRPRTSIARSYAQAYGVPVAVTRFANVYGGGDLNFSRLIPETVVAVLDGRAAGDPLRRQPRARLPPRRRRGLRLPGDRRCARRDGAAGEAFNAGGERPHSVREVVELIADGGRDRHRARLPGRRQPRRRDRPPVRRLDQAPRADRLAAARSSSRRPAAAPSSGTASIPRRALPSCPPSHVRALHGHDQGHEEDRRPLPGRAGTLAGAELRRRRAAAGEGAGEESGIGHGALQRRADPGGAHRALLARPRGGGRRASARRG